MRGFGINGADYQRNTFAFHYLRILPFQNVRLMNRPKGRFELVVEVGRQKSSNLGWRHKIASEAVWDYHHVSILHAIIQFRYFSADNSEKAFSVNIKYARPRILWFIDEAVKSFSILRDDQQRRNYMRTSRLGRNDVCNLHTRN